jgi:hypothetical protein
MFGAATVRRSVRGGLRMLRMPNRHGLLGV